jgi:hypothetical protein
VVRFHSFILQGTVPGAVVDEVIAFARKRGLETVDHRSTFVPYKWDDSELGGVDLIQLVYPDDHESAKYGWLKERRQSFKEFLEQLGALTAADLREMTWQAFIAHSADAWQKLRLLEAMHKQGLGFKDFNPAALFLTEVTEKGLFTVRTMNCLKREGIGHMEVLVIFTAAQLNEIRNLGKKSLDEIRQRLSERGLHLNGE